MTDRLRALVEEQAAAFGLPVAVEWASGLGMVTARLLVDGRFRCAAGVPADALPEDAAMQILDMFQDTVVEDAAGAPLPPCPVPGHPHPAAIRRTTDGIGWRCPRADRPVAH